MPVQPLAEQLRVGTQLLERLAQLVGGDATAQHDAAHLATVQPLGEFLDHRIGAVGRHAVDEQGAPRDADAKRGALRKQGLRRQDERRVGRDERRMTGGIRAVLVERDGNTDQEGID